MNGSRGILRCGLAAVLFGASAPAASRLAGELGAFTLAGLLYLGAALATAPTVAITPPTLVNLRRGGRRLAIAVLFGGAAGPVLLAAGLARTSAANASLLLNLEPVFTTIIAAVFLGEHIGRRVGSGTALVAAAGLLLATTSLGDARWGGLLVVGACLCWAVDNNITAALDELRPAHITFAKGAFAGTANLAIGLTLGGGGPSLAQTGWALLIGAVGYGLSITLWVSGAREIGAARGQLVFAAAPFVGAVIAWTVLAEPVGARQLVATAIAAAGISLVARSAHEHLHTHRPIEHDHGHIHDDGHHEHAHPDGTIGQHQHRHTHDAVVHSHPHVPDIHHRHEHTHD